MMTTAAWETTRQESLVRGVGFACILSAPVWIYNLFFPFPAGFGMEDKPLAILPILVLVITLQLGLIHWRSAGDHFMAEVMLVGFLLKLAAVSLFLFMSIRVYEGNADLFIYFSHGGRIVDNFALTGNWTVLHPISNSNFIIMLTSVLTFVFGPTFQGSMILFAALSYWGQYLFFRAFCVAFPMAQHRSAALLMFFLPSIVFWTASIGKEAVIFFFIGACCYWFASLTATNNPAAFVAILISLGGVMLVRPHIAAMLVISLASSYLLSKNALGVFGASAKILGIPLLVLASVYFVAEARDFVDLGDTQQTAQGTLIKVGEDNYLGGSAFGSSYAYRLAAGPFLLFRPFLWETRNFQAAVASIEAFCLMIFVWRRRDVLRFSLGCCREKAFVLFLWIYAVEFLVVFTASMTNFGLLARQRVMVIPAVLMIVLSQPLGSSEIFQNRPITKGLKLRTAGRRAVQSDLIAQQLGAIRQQL